MYHTDKSVCHGCEKRLHTASPLITRWFRELKGKFINTHIKTAFNDCVEIFQIDEDGNERVSVPFLRKIDKENKASRLRIVWDNLNWFRMKP